MNRGFTASELPLPPEDFLELVKLCVSFNVFTFGTDEFLQNHGLAMGSPLSPVLACLYMEDLEAGPIQDIIGNNLWIRYIDDCLFVGESDSFCDDILKKINNITERLNFTMERAVNNILPFLDTILHLEGEKISFSVYRKPSNKEDYINYFSNHDDRTKRGIIISFFLRAYRISSIQHLMTNSHIL